MTTIGGLPLQLERIIALATSPRHRRALLSQAARGALINNSGVTFVVSVPNDQAAGDNLDALVLGELCKEGKIGVVSIFRSSIKLVEERRNLRGNTLSEQSAQQMIFYFK